ncbi:MAG: Mobile element protein [Burkholderia sp.]|nr:Mobile element protein [Burkholderia sp.]
MLCRDIAVHSANLRLQRTQIAIRLDTVGLRRLNERVQICTGVRTGDGVAEQPVAAPDHKWANGVFTRVVVDRVEAAVDEADQLWPLSCEVMQRTAEQAAGQYGMQVRLSRSSSSMAQP